MLHKTVFFSTELKKNFLMENCFEIRKYVNASSFHSSAKYITNSQD